MKTIPNIFLYICTVFLVLSYEAMADQPISTSIKPIKVYNKEVYTLVQSQAPKTLSPINNSRFSHYPRVLKLRWEAVKNAASYTVEIDCMNCCAARKWCFDVGKAFKVIEGYKDTSYTFHFVGAQPGRWRVQAVDTNGNPGIKSQWVNFTFTK